MFYAIRSNVAFSQVSDSLIQHVNSTGDFIAYVERPLPESPSEQIGFAVQDELDEAYRRIRLWLYQTLADPLFFKEQRGEASPGAWLAEVERIKSTWRTPTLPSAT
jgi:hypothetical protein